MAFGTGYSGTGGSLGGRTSLGTTFRTMFSGKPNAPIKPPKVALPSRPEYGAPVAAPTVQGPNRADYGVPSRDDAKRLNQFAYDTRRANAEFFNPRSSTTFRDMMGLAQEQTGQQVSERQRAGRDVAQRRGYAGGFEDEGREAEQDQMTALASAGFAASDAIRQSASQHYGAASSAFVSLQNSFNEAKSAGDIAFARDLAQTHLANAENTLKAAGLNMEQQRAYAEGLNQARMLQARLDQDFNNSLIDNNKYIEAQAQIAAQLQAQMMALEEKKREFDVESAFRTRQLDEESRRFDLGLKANPNTALRTFDDPRYAAGTKKKQRPLKGSVFTGLE